MTLKFLSIAILWMIQHFPFGNTDINQKITNFAIALPKVTRDQVPVARKYIAELDLVENHPWLSAMNECIDFLDDPAKFDRNTFINDLSRATQFTAIDPGPVERLTRDYQNRALLDRLMPR